MDFSPSVAGLLVGFLVGLTGVGGGALMTPALVLLFGVAPQTAVGTDLLFAFLTKVAGGSVHGRRNAIDWMVVRRLCWGSLPGALSALLALKILAVKGLSGGFIVQALGLALVTTSVALAFKTRLHTIGQHLRSTRPERFKHAQPPLTVAAGFVIGVLVTVTSVGAGALGAAALSYLYPYRLSAQRLVGTDIAHAVPLTLVAGAGHFALGNVETSLLLTLLLGSIPGIVLGALVAHRIREAYLRIALAVVLSIVGVKLILGG